MSNRVFPSKLRRNRGVTQNSIPEEERVSDR